MSATLRFVICGLEHSGTSLVAELFRQVPGLDSGFECGVLLAETPRAFATLEPFCSMMLPNWGLDEAALRRCCDTDALATFYARLLAEARGLRPGTRALFDKTPRYASVLETCLDRVDVPFLFTYKDPVATVWSDFKGSGAADFDAWVEAYLPEKISYMRFHHHCFERARLRGDARVMEVRLESLCLEVGRTARRMFAHVGLRFEPRYLAFRDVRYPNAKSGSISTGIAFEHLDALGEARVRWLRGRLAEFENWFHEPG